MAWETMWIKKKNVGVLENKEDDEQWLGDVKYKVYVIV